MAICASCGAASADGALGCASCGRPLAPPPPAGAPPVPAAAPYVAPVPPPPPTAPGYAPPTAPGFPQPAVPPAVGSWGTGTPYDPAAGQPAALRWLTGADWRPALKAVIAPTAVLLLAALFAAIPDDYDLEFLESPGFGDRFGTALAMSLAALGAPFRMGMTGTGGVFTRAAGELQVRTVPMTVTVLWLFALWLGLRAGVRLRRARTGAPTRGQAAGEALRTALVVAAVTLLIGLASGATWYPDGGRGSGYGRYSRGLEYGSGSGWLEAVGWSALLGGLLAFAVYGTDALRWAAWRNRAVRGWAVAGLAAGRAAAVSVGLASLVGFVLVAVQDESWATGVSVAFLPNLGLVLLGLGSGASVRSHDGARRYDDGYDGYGRGSGSGGPDEEFSLFDLHGETADWRWTLLLAVAAALYLGWTAHRRRLDAADRIRLAVVSAAGFTLLMTVAGFAATTSAPGGGGWGSRSDAGREFSAGLAFGTLLAANVVWVAVGALAVPPLLAAVLRTPAGAPAGVPAGVPAGAVPPQGGPSDGVVLAGGAPEPGVGAEPYPPGPGVAPAVSEVVGSDEPPLPPGAAAPGAGGEPPVDPSVWRKQP
ncbi:hypothetical protein ACFVHB_01250 [Kitasatospora sp. NPDC127111]|uniref:hypothetical protein n=1 Tax=Kitasatospora sp. NPDC127111 TaxID=3345363 RepID=UPI00363B0F43